MPSIEEELKLKGVRKYSGLRVWSINRGKYCGAVKVVVETGRDWEETKSLVDGVFKDWEVEGYVELEGEKSG